MQLNEMAHQNLTGLRGQNIMITVASEVICEASLGHLQARGTSEMCVVKERAWSAPPCECIGLGRHVSYDHGSRGDMHNQTSCTDISWADCDGHNMTLSSITDIPFSNSPPAVQTTATMALTAPLLTSLASTHPAWRWS